jgi:acyl-coenzyme A thioesterase PaaI-like protein
VPLSLAVFAHLGQWLPTIEIKTSFLAPARIGVCVAEGNLLRAGTRVVFTEAKLWSADKLVAHATATALVTAP